MCSGGHKRLTSDFIFFKVATTKTYLDGCAQAFQLIWCCQPKEQKVASQQIYALDGTIIIMTIPPVKMFARKKGFVTATKLGTTNEFFAASTKNFAAATKRFVDITKHFVLSLF